jgi:hypothetical protein
MTSEEQLKKANEILKSIHIKQAIPQNFAFNPAYAEDTREILLDLSIKKKLEKLGGEIIVENGEARIVRKGNPDLDLYNERQEQVTLNKLVPEAIAGLGTTAIAPAPSAIQSKQSNAYDEYEKDGITHTRVGNMTYKSSYDIRKKMLTEQKPRTVQETIDDLTKKLGINP